MADHKEMRKGNLKYLFCDSVLYAKNLEAIKAGKSVHFENLKTVNVLIINNVTRSSNVHQTSKCFLNQIL